MDKNYNQNPMDNVNTINNQLSTDTPETNVNIMTPSAQVEQPNIPVNTPETNVNIMTPNAQTEQPNQPVPQITQQENSPAPKKKKTLLYVLLFIILILGAVFVKLYLDNNKKNNNITDNSTNNVDNSQTVKEDANNDATTDTSNVVASNELFQVIVKGVEIKFPATKASFEGTGWTWDEKYATKKLDTGYTASGGRIGTYPGGVVVGVVNLSGEMKEIQDCIIDDGTFYNPKDGSNDVVFIGGLTYSSTEEQVKNKMIELKYNNVKESNSDDLTNYRYYKDDDQNNFKDYIEFSFYDGILSYVGIYTTGE